MPLAPGTRLGPHEVVSLLGKGGMGEVYRARDTKLGRDVAIKVLPDELAFDEERVARFEREAKLLASLNHPNIASIYGFEESEGVKALVLELVEGPTLAERIAQGPIPVEEAIAIAKQIAVALEAGHEAGIIHRDLKPANIKVKDDGTVKVLDYGLAKALEAESLEGSDPALSQSPTLTREGTRMGVIFGTASYMSPEQARGKRVDKRTDIWAFGCCLYEALTAQKAFPGENAAETMARVIEREPDWAVLPPVTPLGIELLLRRCLSKKQEDRLRDIGDARLELRDTYSRSLSLEAGPSAGGRFALFVYVALAAAALGGLATWLLMNRGPATPPLSVHRATIALPADQTQPRLTVDPLALSPDGKLLVYVAEDEAGSGLFLRPLDGFEATRLPGTEGADIPFFSPEGDWVGFFAAGKLKKVSISRGSVLTLARAPDGLGASWGPDGTIIFTPSMNAGLFRVPENGGTPERLTTPDFGEAGYAHVWPQHLPGGEAVLFSIWGSGMQRAAVLDLSTNDWDVVQENVGGASYVASGHILYYDLRRGAGLLAAPFDVERRAITGETIQVVPNVRVYASQSSRPYIATASNGTLVYVAEESALSTLAWMDRSGATTPLLREPGSIGMPRLSPDDERVVFHDEQGNVKVFDIDRGAVDTVLRETGSMEATIWNPRGSLTVASTRAGSWDLYDTVVTARGELEPILVRENDQWPTSWTSDGTQLAFFELHPATGFDLWAKPLGEEPRSVLSTPASEYQGAFSPDGSLLAYTSDESGRAEVYLREYPEGETQLISASGGNAPVWSKDGGELFYRNGRKFFAVELTDEPGLHASAPEKLHEVPFDRGYPHFPDYYDVAADGRFLVVEDRSTTYFNVVFNWTSELERLVPTR